MKKNKYYVYCWWSGICIEEEVYKIKKIKDNIIFFYNNYCQEYQQADVRNCRKLNNYYINERVQY